MKNTTARILISFILLGIISCNTQTNGSQTSGTLTTEELLKQDIAKYPDSLELVHKLIELYRDEGSFDSALLLTDDQIKKDSDNAFLWNMKATLHFENGDTMQSVKALEHAINIYPLPDYLVALGTVFAEMKNPRCLIIADSLIDQDRIKSGKDAMFIRGLYYSYNKDYQKSIPYFDSSLHMDFTYMPSYREKAIAFYELGEYQNALNVLKRAVTLQNNYDEGYYWMGQCYEKLNKKQDAIQSYQTALLYDKDYIEAKEALDSLQNKN
jgi:tetratricopeptide (TPR) repeat protein